MILLTAILLLLATVASPFLQKHLSFFPSLVTNLLDSAHCEALSPEYEEAAAILKEKNIKLAKVDCTEEAELCKSLDIVRYPTLKVFRDPDKISVYKRARKATAYVSPFSNQ